MVVCDIRGNIDARDEYLESQKAAEKEIKKSKSRGVQFNNVYLGSMDNSGAVTIAALTAAHSSDAAFRNFETKLTTCIRDLVSREAEADRLATTEPVRGRDVHIHGSDKVH